jgi:GNAT superfamily N-acetyltransferase
MLPRYAELTRGQLARLTEENLYDFLTALSRNRGAEIVSTPYLTRYSDRSIVSPMFNGVIRTNIPSDQVSPIVEATLDYFRSRARPLAFWWVSPSARPADLGAQLVAHGLAEYAVDTPTMAADLHALPASVAAPAECTIEVVRDRASAQTWGDTFSAIHGMPQFAGQAWVDSAARSGIDDAPYRLYLGRLRGEPIATSMLVWGAGAAGLLNVGTLPEARGQGIGSAITLQPCLDARAVGYHIGVLSATEQGLPVYRRLGFREVGTISRYVWRAD